MDGVVPGGDLAGGRRRGCVPCTVFENVEHRFAQPLGIPDDIERRVDVDLERLLSDLDGDQQWRGRPLDQRPQPYKIAAEGDGAGVDLGELEQRGDQPPIRSICPWMAVVNSSRRLSGSFGSASSSVITEREVSGVRSWWEMSASASAR